jgi:MFS family permease
MASVLSTAAQSVAAFRVALGNADLRRVELAFVGFNVAEYGTWIAIMVFAYGVGGATAAGIIGVVQLVPAALFAPAASYLGDRYPRNRVLVAGYLAQALCMSLTGAAMIRGAPPVLIYALAASAATSVTLTRPVQGALLPSLAHSPSELVAANVAGSWVEGLGLFAGPLATGLLLAVSTPGAVFLIMGGVTFSSALLVAGVTTAGKYAADDHYSGPGAVFREVWGGYRTAMKEPGPRLLISLMGANFVLVGAIDVLLVVLSIQLLGLGSPGVGYLTAAFGLGGLAGAAGATVLTARRHLVPVLFIAAVAWAAGLAVVGLIPSRTVAPLLIIVAGTGRPLIDVVGRILLQRVVSDQVLSRVFGVLEGLSMAAQALGAILVPALVSLLNARLAFVVFGALPPLVTLALWRGLKRIDSLHVVAEDRLPLLRSVSIFAPLSTPVQLQLASRLIPVTAAPNSVVIREGDRGDRFYIVRKGRVSVSIGGTPVRTLGPGDFFGEIALLHNIPRTARVTADADTSLFALDREDFLEVLTGHAQSAEAAHAVSRARLGKSV